MFCPLRRGEEGRWQQHRTEEGRNLLNNSCAVSFTLPERRLPSGGAASQWRSFKSGKLKQSPRCWFMVEKQLLGIIQIHWVSYLILLVQWHSLEKRWQMHWCNAYLQRLSFVASGQPNVHIALFRIAAIFFLYDIQILIHKLWIKFFGNLIRHSQAN